MLLNLDRAILSGTTGIAAGTGPVIINPQHIALVNGAGDEFYTVGGDKVKVLSIKDKVEITFSVAADGVGDELFFNGFAGATNASFVVESGTRTGTQVSFRGNDSLEATDNVVARVNFNQATNATLSDQLDAMVANFNALPTIYEEALDISNDGKSVIQRNSVARKDGSKLIIEKITYEPSSTITLGGASAWTAAPTISDSTYTDTSAGDSVEIVWNAATTGQPGRLAYSYTINSKGDVVGTVY